MRELNKPWKTRRLSGARLAIVGCGDVGLRLLTQLKDRVKCVVIGRSNVIVKVAHPKTACLSADLDDRKALSRIKAIAPWAVYLAPPPNTGLDDSRMRHFIAGIGSKPLKRCVYVSTTGVYGAANGAWVRETSPKNPTQARGVRRLAAEQRLKRSTFAHTTVLRAPGIYATQRLPIERIKQGLPALLPADDVPTNHIHADDLARLCWLGLFRGRNRRIYNAADGQPMMHGDYLQAVANTFNLPAAPRLPHDQVKAALSPIAWSMLSGARRVSSERLLQEWPVKLKYPSMQHFLSTVRSSTHQQPIGVFDSGMGGLSVLRDLCCALPQENFVYFADSFHAPYGEKGDAFVRERSLSIVQQLRHVHGVKAIVVACNTATAAAITDVREAHPDLIVIGIEPAIKPAAALSVQKKIAVFATQGTLNSVKFQTLLSEQSAHASFVTVACDGLAEAIERHGHTLDHPDIVHLVQQYAAPIATQAVDTVVLGCTHYPLVKSLFKSALPPTVNVVDNGSAVAKRLFDRLTGSQLLAHSSGFPPATEPAHKKLANVEFISSGNAYASQALQALWLKLHHD